MVSRHDGLGIEIGESVHIIVAVTFGRTDMVLLVAIVVLLVLAGCLALAETALVGMSRAKAQVQVEAGAPSAHHLLELVSHPEQFLNSLLLSVLVCQLVQATLSGILGGRLFGAWGVAVGTVFNIVVVFVLTEAAPKTWAVQHSERAALLVARPVAVLVGFWPLRIISRALIGLTNVILPGKGLKEGPFVTEAELLALAEAAVAEDVIEAGERELIEQVIDFGDTIVREVMVPRPDMVAVSTDFRVADAMEVVLLNGFSRIPVYQDGIDDVVGIVYAKDLMRAERDGMSATLVGSLLRNARFVPETKRVATLLPEMQADQFHMAIVVDEYGGTAGVVTLEDLIEELVGEIVDEFDREEPMIEPMADGSVRVNAKMPVDEVNDLLNSELLEGDWDSIGGLMFHLLGHVPIEGESVECDGRELSADRVQGRRIHRVRISPRKTTEREDRT